MAVSPEVFPARKRRPSAGAFLSPNLTGRRLVRSLFLLAQEISSLKPLGFLLQRKSVTIIRKAKVLSVVFEELLRIKSFYSSSTLLCFEEMYIVLQRMKTLFEDCCNGSKMWILFQMESIAYSFHELIVELATLLDIFPVNELGLSQDVVELVILVRRHCTQSKAFVDPRDGCLRRKILEVLDGIRSEIVPEQSRLKKIFEELGFRDSSSCRDEIERLEDEIQNQIDDRSRSEVVSLIGLVRYGKCVLYGPSTPPKSDLRRYKSASETNVPSDFRCPISLELMRDPVVVSTGQTYDRSSINLWIESGHNTCPKTGQTLAHTDLIPNRALRNLIAMWCREQRVPFESLNGDEKPEGAVSCKTALEFTKITASFLVEKLTSATLMDDANGVVYELRALAKSDSVGRACIAEAGAIPNLVRYLGSEHPNLQVNAVTTILNLSILDENKTRIMETDGALNGVIEVLRSGATWEAKGNAAATLFSLCGVHAFRKRLVKKTRVVKGLLDLVKVGPAAAKRDALAAVLSLAGERDAVARMLEGGVIEAASEAAEDVPEEAVAVMEAVVRRGGLMAVAAAYRVIPRLGGILREGSVGARETAAATLVAMCRKGGSELVAEVAAVAGIERVIWELMGTGTARARRKAASLMRYLRRWAAGLDEGGRRNQNEESRNIVVPEPSTIF